MLGGTGTLKRSQNVWDLNCSSEMQETVKLLPGFNEI